MSLVYNNLVEDICLVIDENNIRPFQKEKLKKRVRKLEKKGKLNFKADALWLWRLCAARLMRGQFDKWFGYEFRSKWSADFVQNDWIYPRWDGKNGKIIALAEQGIGDEILFASVYGEFLKDCPDATIEADSRLLPVLRRSFPKGNFVSRWVNDDTLQPKYPDNYVEGAYEGFVPCGDLLKIYRTGHRPPGDPYLIPDPLKVDAFKQNGKSIGISWMGGRSKLLPEQLKKQDGNYFGLQYKVEDGKIVSDRGPDWLIDLNIDHNDFDQLFAVVAAMDEINTVQSVIAHIAGSQGKKCNVIKPPPEYASDEDNDNNRLKWYYGKGGKMLWYKSLYVYNSYKEFKHSVQ